MKPLTEATRPVRIRKIVDPAMLPFREWVKRINRKNKYHCDNAYNISLDKLNEYQSKEKFPDLVNTIRRRGRVFEIRKVTVDRAKDNMVKTTPDGEVLFHENGEPVYMTFDEKLNYLGDRRYRTDFAAIDKKTGKVVAVTEDEWDCLLVMTAKEFRNFGLGTILTRLFREVHPEIDSGGFTPSGYRNAFRVWSEMVRDYLASGFYSEFVKKGYMTKEQVKEILADLPKRSRRSLPDMDFGNRKHVVFLFPSDYSILLFDYRLLSQDVSSQEIPDMFTDEGIFAHINIHPFEDRCVPEHIYGQTEKDLALALYVLLSSIDGECQLYLDDSIIQLLQKHTNARLREVEEGVYELENPIPMHVIESLKRKSAAIIGKLDPYREMVDDIILRSEYMEG